MKVLWITNVPSPYRVDFFNELGKQCELIVLFEKRTSDERDKSWLDFRAVSFTSVFLRGSSVNTDTAFCPSVIKYISDKSIDQIVLTNLSSPTGIIAIEFMKAFRIPYWLEGDGAFAKNGKSFRERLKRHLISGAKGYFSTSKAHDNYYLTYGAAPDRIYRYPFSSIHKADVVDKPTNTDEKNSLRSALGLKGERIVVTVGRFSYKNGYGKGYDILLKACEKLPKNYGVYIIGDKPTDEFTVWKEQKELTHVHFLGFKRKDELFKYYRAADAFVLLSRGEAWGLVINEAMANGLPVITTDRCVAGLELVRNGENGYIVPVGDVTCTVEAIQNVLSADTIKMGTRSLNIIRDYTIESMADAHAKLLSERG